MKTIMSLSGGKTSSYMATHYESDFRIFALVLINDRSCSPKDIGLIREVSDRIGKEFIATAEDDITLRTVLQLEQKIGKPITWVSGDPFDDVIKKNSLLPCAFRRFCTTEMKIKPIFEWWKKNIGEKVIMGIGYRYDEKERAERFTNTFRTVIGKRQDGKNRWHDIEWRTGWFPMIDDKVGHYTVHKWANNSGIVFPVDSNCVGCFHKNDQQLRKNWEDHPNKLAWFSSQEKIGKGKFKKELTYEKIKTIGIQQDFIFGGGSGCQAGFCTD